MKTIKLFLKAACLALIAASCANDIDKNVKMTSGQFFEASFVENAEETRVVLSNDYKKVTWELSDAIGIFDAGFTTSVKASIASVEDGGKKAIFSPVTAVVSPVFAIHPYQAGATADGSSVTTIIPSASKGVFTESCIAVAKADDGKFAFHSAVAIFSFKVSDPAVKSVVIDGAGIAGGVKATVDGAGNISVAPYGTAVNQIVVSDVTPDQRCYVAVVPKTYSGLTFTYKDKDDKELGKTKCADKMTVASGDILDWGDFAILQKAYLPTGSDFIAALTAAAGDITNITNIYFMTGYKPAGTIINNDAAPVGMEYLSGSVFVCTPANQFIANADCSLMFKNLKNVQTISGLDKWDTSEVTNMYSMFNGCNELTTADISGFNTSKVTSMAYMFANTKLKPTNLSHFDVSSVKEFQSMFAGLSGITDLDLSTFNMASAEKTSTMFWGMKDLKTLTIGPNFKFPSENDYMFHNLGVNNSVPYTTFYCDVDQWNKISEIIGSTDIVNYKWGNAPAAALLPTGENFRNALKKAADNDLTNIKTITFKTLSSKIGTKINEGLGDTPVYVSYSGGDVTVSTQAESFIANANSRIMFIHMEQLTDIVTWLQSIPPKSRT